MIRKICFLPLAFITFSRLMAPPVAQQKNCLPANPKEPPGSLYAVDSIVGNLRYAPGGTFIQGSPDMEACRSINNEDQFQHTLTKNLAVMETEVNRQMWADLKAVQPNLPVDPTNTL